MLAQLLRYKREFVYSILLFVVLQTAQIPEVLAIPELFLGFAALGAVIVSVWCLMANFVYTEKDGTERNEIILRQRLRERFLLYFIIPTFFYLALVLYLYNAESVILKQAITIAGVATFLLEFINIRLTYQKNYTIVKHLRVVSNFIDIFIFYLATSAITFYGFEWWKLIGMIAGIAGLLLIQQLYVHQQRNLQGLSIMLFSTAAITGGSYIILGIENFVFKGPLLMTLMFYLVIALWNVRLSGHTKLDEYITPVLFTMMGLIVILSL